MEKFKGHTYPDVLISVLIEAFENIRTWLSEGAIAPATKKSFWKRIAPARKPLQRSEASRLTEELGSYLAELESLLHARDHAGLELLRRNELVAEESGRLEAAIQRGPARVGASGTGLDRTATVNETKEILRRSKTDFLHRKIIAYQKTLKAVAGLAGANGFVLLDDVYHIRRTSQADVLDYFHRLFKGTGLCKSGHYSSQVNLVPPRRPGHRCQARR